MNNIEDYYEEYNSQITHYLRSCVHNVDDVDQILSETWLAICKGIKGYDDSRPFINWAITVAKSKISDYFRKNYHKKEIEFTSCIGNQYCDYNFMDFLLIEPERPSPIDAMIMKESIELIIRGVDQLSDIFKYCIVQYYFKNLTTKEISNRLKIPEGTIKSRLFSARQKLKLIIEKTD